MPQPLRDEMKSTTGFLVPITVFPNNTDSIDMLIRSLYFVGTLFYYK